MIDQQTINQIFETADIVEVISDFVTLKRSGTNYKGLSPFTNEKTPSFMVSPAKGIFKDFSSGKGGNVVGFLMEHEKLSYPEALRYLAQKYNIPFQERELTAEKVPYEVGHSHFKHLARAQITGRTTGMLKILFHRESLKILVVHCFGYGASEIIHIGQAILAQEGSANSLMYFINTTFNYPTMAEAYRVAALNGLNRLS